MKTNTTSAVEALRRIAEATPLSTNSRNASQMSSWARAVAQTAIAALEQGEGEIGCAEREVGRYVYRLIEARMNTKPGTREFAELDYLTDIVSDVEEHGAHELSVDELRATPGSLSAPTPSPGARWTGHGDKALYRVAETFFAELFRMGVNVPKWKEWGPKDRRCILAALKSALSTLNATPPAGGVGWKLIESAPKDGTEIDLWVLGRRVANCRWGKPTMANWGDRYGCDKDLPEGWMTRTGHALDRRLGEPTHWMPEPPAPDAAPDQPPGRDDLRHMLKDAFVAGCCAVLTWTNSGMPQDDLDEAGYDYAASALLPPSAAPAVQHASDCAVHNEPALPAGPCDCGAAG